MRADCTQVKNTDGETGHLWHCADTRRHMDFWLWNQGDSVGVRQNRKAHCTSLYTGTQLKHSTLTERNTSFKVQIKASPEHSHRNDIFKQSDTSIPGASAQPNESL